LQDNFEKFSILIISESYTESFMNIFFLYFYIFFYLYFLRNKLYIYIFLLETVIQLGTLREVIL